MRDFVSILLRGCKHFPVGSSIEKIRPFVNNHLPLLLTVSQNDWIRSSAQVPLTQIVTRSLHSVPSIICGIIPFCLLLLSPAGMLYFMALCFIGSAMAFLWFDRASATEFPAPHYHHCAGKSCRSFPLGWITILRANTSLFRLSNC